MRFTVHRSTTILSALAGVLLAASAAVPGSAAACTCPAEPDVTCQPVASFSMLYADSDDDPKDKLTVILKGSQGPLEFEDLGDPSSTDSSCLCLYDNGELTPLAHVPAGGTCGTVPCWTSKPFKSWSFKDASGANDGVTLVTHAYSAADRVSGAKIVARGQNVVDLTLPFTGPVVVQLRETNGYCIGTELASTEYDPEKGKLKAKQKLSGLFPSCSDGIQNGFEEGVDCGGPCDACISCTDGIQNGDETDVDCGGSCDACPTCRDGIQNGDETAADCGGPDCPLCPTGVPKRIMVGLHYSASALANLAQIDQHCTEIAQGLDPTAGTFLAWLCTGEDDDPDSRFTKYSDPYVRFDNTSVVIAGGGWNQLTGGGALDNSVEPFFAAAGPYIWTGTTTDGQCGAGLPVPPQDCLGWTSELATDQATYGNSTLTGGGSWNAAGPAACSSYFAVYCVEQ